MLTYFLQVNLCWLMFYGLYWALLSRETFFKLNRIYLIITLLGGLALPLVADWLHKETALVLPFEGILLPIFEFSINGNGLSVVDSPTLLPVGRGWSWWAIISSIYFIGFSLEMTRFLMGLFKLYRLNKTAHKEVKSSYTLLITEGVCQPFSFFKYVFISRDLLQSADFQNIMRHELAHVKQKHSWDVIALEVIQIIFWLSPCVYLYKNSLRNVHEYLADAAVLRSVSKRQYGSLLIQQSQAGKSIAFVNPFFSQLKKRILMMTRNPSKRRSLVKYALAAPIFFTLVILLASPDNPVMAKTAHVSNEIKSTITQLETPSKKQVKAKTENVTEIKNQEIKPIAVAFGNKKGGVITAEDFKKFDGLTVIDAQTGKELVSTKISYVLVMIPKHEDPRQADVNAKTSKDAVKLVSYAKDGTQYSFMNIKAQLEGETKMRELGSMSYFVGGKIKVNLNDTTDINRVQLDKISPSEIASVNVKKSENGRSEIIIVLKTGKVLRTYPSEIEMKNDTKKSLDGNVKFSFTKNESQVFTVADESPEFPQGQSALFKWLGENIRYPAVSRENGIQGTVYIGFVVEKDGSITDITVKRGVKGIVRDTVTIMEVNGVKGNKYVEREDHSIDNEAKRVIAAMPKWKPGKNKGELVRVAYTLPIKFKLD